MSPTRTSVKTRCPHRCIVDLVVVERLISHAPSTESNHCERREAVRRMHGWGLTDAGMAERTGLNHRTMFRIRKVELGLPANDPAHQAAWSA